MWMPFLSTVSAMSTPTIRSFRPPTASPMRVEMEFHWRRTSRCGPLFQSGSQNVAASVLKTRKMMIPRLQKDRIWILLLAFCTAGLFLQAFHLVLFLSALFRMMWSRPTLGQQRLLFRRIMRRTPNKAKTFVGGLSTEMHLRLAIPSQPSFPEVTILPTCSCQLSHGRQSRRLPGTGVAQGGVMGLLFHPRGRAVTTRLRERFVDDLQTEVLPLVGHFRRFQQILGIPTHLLSITQVSGPLLRSWSRMIRAIVFRTPQFTSRLVHSSHSVQDRASYSCRFLHIQEVLSDLQRHQRFW